MINSLSMSMKTLDNIKKIRKYSSELQEQLVRVQFHNPEGVNSKKMQQTFMKSMTMLKVTLNSFQDRLRQVLCNHYQDLMLIFFIR